MSGVGLWELILVFLIGLIVLGPERLPRVAHQLGTWLGQARRMTRMMRRQLEDELNLEQELSIRPRARPLPKPERPVAKPETSVAKPDRTVPPPDDDTWSPAHDKSAAGTGVGSDVSGDADPQPEPGASGDQSENDAADPAVKDSSS